MCSSCLEDLSMIARIWVPDLDFREMNGGTIYGHAQLRFFLASPVRLMRDEALCAFTGVGVADESKLCDVAVSVGCVGCTLKAHTMDYDETDV